jgi:hypothetical protein
VVPAAIASLALAEMAEGDFRIGSQDAAVFHALGRFQQGARQPRGKQAMALHVFMQACMHVTMLLCDHAHLSSWFHGKRRTCKHATMLACRHVHM